MNASELRKTMMGGVVPAVPIPFDARGRFQREWQRTYVDWMGQQEIPAVAVWAHTGRGLMIDEDLRGEVLESWKTTELPIVCGAGVPTGDRLPSDPRARTDVVMARAVTMAEQAAAAGAVGLLVHPPTALRDLSDPEARIIAYHEAVAGVGLPFLLFLLYEAAGGIAYSRPVLETVLGWEGTVGIKLATLDSVVTYQNVVDLLMEWPDALVVTGEDRFLGYSLMLGGQCALIGMAAALTDRCVALVRAHADGRSEDFLARSRAIDRFASATFVAPMEGYVQRMLWALTDDGVLPEDAFDPFGPPLDAVERTAVRAAVRALRAQ